MKKTYNTPTTTVNNIEVRLLLSASVNIGVNNYNGTDEIESREFDYDDEEDEE